MRGRKPVPTAVKLLYGNPGKRPLNTQEPQLPPPSPVPPDWLDDTAKAKWTEKYPALAASGLLTAGDLDTFAAYCSAYSNWRRATEEGQRHKLIFRTPGGAVQQVPYVSIARNWMQLMVKIAAELGLTPSARSRVHAEQNYESYPELARIMLQKVKLPGGQE